MKNQTSAIALLLIASSFLSTTAASGASYDRPEIVVTATPLSELLQPVQVLDERELLLRAAPTLGETLANELGLSSTYFGPAASRPVIRGLSGSRVTMLMDSASTLDVADVSPDHAVTVEMLLADGAEIIRGPVNLLYGSSAAGGVVNVLDNRIPTEFPKEPVSGGFEIRGDTASGEEAYVGRLDGGLGASDSGLAWHLDGFTRNTDTIDIPGFATADPAERPDTESSGTLLNSYSDSDGVTTGLSWVGNQGYIGASLGWLDSTYGLPGPEPAEEGEEEPALYEGPFLDMEQTRADLRGEYAIDHGLADKVKLTLASNNYEHREIEPTGEVATTFENDQWQSRLELSHKAIAGFRGTLGMQLDDRDLSAIGEEAFITPTSTDAQALFLVEEREFDWGSLQLGTRFEVLEHDNAALADYDRNAWSFAAGFGFDIGEAHELTLGLSRTQRHPGAEEVYSDGAHIATRQYEVGLIASGADARTEDALNVEIGLQRVAGPLLWEVSAYYYDFSDYVYQDLPGAIVDDFPEAVYTQDDAEFYGADAAVTLPLQEGDEPQRTLRLFGDFVRAELDNGNDLPRIPPWRLGANLDIGFGRWLASLDLIYHADQDDISSYRTDEYTLLNVGVLVEVPMGPARWEIFARGTNLLDEDARKSTSFLAAYAPLPGRSLSGGARLRF